MKLSILIPTYNRSLFLKKNLEILISHINKGNFINEIEFVISNNNSTDNTDAVLSEFKKQHTDIQLRYYLQKKNIGLENNALFVLKEAKGNFVMFLGDDDYVDILYLEGVLLQITNHKNLHCIIPSNIPIDINGNQLIGERDIKLKSKVYEFGFGNCLENSWRGHQLSGLVLKRDGLYNSYIEREVGNIYLFIYFVGYCCLNGDTYHFTDYPIKVTSPGQDNKDWNYGKDGLINEIFDNYNKLPVSYLGKSLLQLHFFKKQSWRLWGYRDASVMEFFKAFFKIWFAPNGTFIFKTFFPIEFIGIYTINKAKRFF